jgi:aryl-alcohol dehydrogenase-like predicted oxidoreductase
VDLADTTPSLRLLDRYAAAGGRTVDVANVYRDGEAARTVGRWLDRGGGGGEMVLCAKGCHPPRCRPELVPDEVDLARRLLDAEHLDVFVLHRDDPACAIAAWADALLEQVARGAIGAFGVSNWTVARVRELHDHLAAIGEERRLRVLSNHFSLAEMISAPWDGCLALSRDEVRDAGQLGLEVHAWSSLGIGFFAGRDTPQWDSPANRARRERAETLAARLGTTAPAVALAYVLHQGGHVRPVVGTRSEAHLDEALAAERIALDPADVAWLERGEAS